MSMQLPPAPGELQLPGLEGQREIFLKEMCRMRAVLAVTSINDWPGVPGKRH